MSHLQFSNPRPKKAHQRLGREAVELFASDRTRVERQVPTEYGAP